MYFIMYQGYQNMSLKISKSFLKIDFPKYNIICNFFNFSFYFKMKEIPKYSLFWRTDILFCM